MDTEGKIRHLFDLFAKFGHENYIGEEVSQLQHAQVRGHPLIMSDFWGVPGVKQNGTQSDKGLGSLAKIGHPIFWYSC